MAREAKNRKVNLSMTESEAKALGELAAANNVSISEYVRRLIAQSSDDKRMPEHLLLLRVPHHTWRELELLARRANELHEDGSGGLYRIPYGADEPVWLDYGDGFRQQTPADIIHVTLSKNQDAALISDITVEELDEAKLDEYMGEGK